MRLFQKILIIFIFPLSIFTLNYDVKFSGLKDRAAINAIKRVSNLVILQKRAPKTINALRFRANSDMPEMIKILHFYGFYDAKIEIEYEEKEFDNNIIVNIFIIPGPRYTIKDANIYIDCIEKKKLDSIDISIDDLDLEKNSPLITQKILNAQKKLLFLLASKGYPLAKVEKRDVIIDVAHKNASIDWCIDLGSFSLFGPTSITGLKDIDKSFIEKKINWDKKKTYDIEKVIQTQQDLLKTNLFSSVAIIHDDKVDKNCDLNMHIKLVEALHKYVTAGVSYATVDGFGVSFGWANRNFRSRGEILAIDANIAQRLFLGAATYKKPNFIKKNQDYVLRFEASRDKIPITYLAFNYSMENRIDKKISKKVDGSLGFNMEYDEITHSANDGNFFLLSLPMYLKYSSANHLLNPTHGQTIIYRAWPFKNTINSAKAIVNIQFIYPLRKI